MKIDVYHTYFLGEEYSKDLVGNLRKRKLIDKGTTNNRGERIYFCKESGMLISYNGSIQLTQGASKVENYLNEFILELNRGKNNGTENIAEI